MGRSRADANASGATVWAALWVVYLIWGSTYLAIRVGVHPSRGVGFPPLLFAAARFLVAGVLMLALSLPRQPPDGRPDPLGPKQWWAAFVVGTALLLGGNGLVTIAEQRVASGVTAVVIATVPIWAALLGAAWGQERFSRRHATGLALGLAGVGVLALGHGGHRADPVGVLVVLAAAVSWAGGSVWSRTAPLVRRPLVLTGMEMVCGGVTCAIAGLLTGEGGDLHLAAVPARSWVALGYLVVAGSMLAFTAYAWLLRNARLSLVITYAYVNPVVAVVLGALILHEPFDLRAVFATITVMAGVALMITAPRHRPPVAAAEATSPPHEPAEAAR